MDTTITIIGALTLLSPSAILFHALHRQTRRADRLEKGLKEATVALNHRMNRYHDKVTISGSTTLDGWRDTQTLAIDAAINDLDNAKATLTKFARDASTNRCLIASHDGQPHIKISKPGVDVLTARDSDLIVNKMSDISKADFDRLAAIVDKLVEHHNEHNPRDPRPAINITAIAPIEPFGKRDENAHTLSKIEALIDQFERGCGNNVFYQEVLKIVKEGK